MCNYYILFLFAAVIYRVNGQVEDGTSCTTPTNQNGQCINILNCKVVTNLLRTEANNVEVRSYVRSLYCGSKYNTPYVCCPADNTRNILIKPDETSFGESDKFLSPPACGLSNATLPKVVGGIPAKLGEFPWMVSLGYRNLKNPSQTRWLCGGTLISHRHVLTAAHCVVTDLYLARVGELDLYDDNDGANPTDIEIEKTKVHENYDATKHINDIAVLALSRSTEGLVGVWPICLPWEADKKNRSFLGNQPFVAGWGNLQFNGPSSTNLQLATIPVVENSKCKKAYESAAIIDESILCAGWDNGNKDACKGDSGGPLMYGTVQRDTKGIRFFQIGVVSYGFQCAVAGYPGVYTRVTYFLNWIGNNLN
ncbi:venom protease [Dendroctonus ponderosae]|uniref:CLIP domain-containing serine protease n=1 Tax=Dendroctonus ponderosae TaxID=77166 RepID=U4TZ65_DENPD|nr:venom protease [Dendroctonus ponderosae]ERL86132.1 hypothetical protein D910_03546 [Dendroctonus ponderosae]KAH1029921.1 hypothetical protein HUJ05_003068 [Dendroctonus ponderosae]